MNKTPIMPKIEYHLAIFNIHKSALLVPESDFNINMNKLKGLELDNLEACLASQFNCMGDDGHDFNTSRHSLFEFLKVNPSLHTNNEIQQIYSNLSLVRNKIQEFEELLVLKFDQFAKSKNQNLFNPAQVLNSSNREKYSIENLSALQF